MEKKRDNIKPGVLRPSVSGKRLGLHVSKVSKSAKREINRARNKEKQMILKAIRYGKKRRKK
jgi:hypothetical protein